MRERDREPIDGGSLGQRQRAALSRGAAEQRVHKSRRALLAGLARHLHRVVHHGGRGDAIQMEDLKEPDAKDGQDFAVEPCGRTSRERHDHVIERRLPAKDA
jgi:hypothetical protein